MAHYLAQHLRLGEPELSFHLTEQGYRTQNPLEGLRQWGPYDSSIPGSFRPNPLRLAVISTEAGLPSLLNHLNSLNTVCPIKKPSEYLQEYPGFGAVFRTNLSFPTNASHPLVSLIQSNEIAVVRQEAQPQLAFLELLKRRIQTFVSLRHEFDVLIIHIPNELELFREKTESDFRFDLHDALKASCAPIQIKIQLVEDSSFRYPEPAQVYWWLSLALYTKANGVPWKLAHPSPETAYVGLAYGIKPGTGTNRVVLGCSQIFDEHGEGLQFLLFPLENPQWRGRGPIKKPFMNRTDARRLFEEIRTTYQRRNIGPPRRLVVHKTTYFSREEIEGISEACTGIAELELITIQQNTNLLGIKYDAVRQQIGNYPVARGTVLPLNVKSFLLWTQGDVLGVAGQNRHFYQEKRAIPSPLVITRYRGRSSLEEVAEDILKLTKMNWNNLQYSNRLPVTVSFAQKISQIVKQLDASAPTPYDFRYFI